MTSLSSVQPGNLKPPASYVNLQDGSRQPNDQTRGQKQQEGPSAKPIRYCLLPTTFYIVSRPEDVIYHDLMEVNMQWPLGCYGLNLNWDTGDNVIHGDFSPEELRCEAYAQMRSHGSIEAYKNTLISVLQERRRIINDLKNALPKAVALARTPRAFRMQIPTTTVDGGRASTHISIANGTRHQYQQPHPHQLQSQQSLLNHNNITTTSGTTTANYSSQELDSFVFGDIPEVPPPT